MVRQFLLSGKVRLSKTNLSSDQADEADTFTQLNLIHQPHPLNPRINLNLCWSTLALPGENGMTLQSTRLDLGFLPQTWRGKKLYVKFTRHFCSAISIHKEKSWQT
jgi:hypothetical protein